MALSIDHHAQLIRDAARDGAQVIILQELFAQPYVGARIDEAHFAEASAVDGSLIQQMSALSQELSVWLVVPFFEQAGPGVYYNAAVVLNDQGERVLHYRKNHVPEDPGFHEKYLNLLGSMVSRGSSLACFTRSAIHRVSNRDWHAKNRI
jgi:N-carbamoylputrescine amidase